MSNATQPIIELQGLEVRFGRPILKGLTASLSGRCIGLLGPNGAGKTTLLHTLLGFHKPSAGTARIYGHDIKTEIRTIRGLMGYMPEMDAFIAGMTAVRFIRLMAELSGLPSERALERAHEMLFYVGLGEARYRNIDTYSLGMKQLAKLAQALVHGPRLIFLDEPTNGLDPDARERMLKMIKDIRDAGEIQMILSSHLLRDVEECCDEVLVLKGGQIAYALMGDANASIPTPQPRTMRPMFATFGKALQQSSITFLSQAAIDAGVPGELGLEKIIRPVSGIRTLAKADLKYNGATPDIQVDPETYKVTVDGEDVTCEPSDVLPMAQRYFLF